MSEEEIFSNNNSNASNNQNKKSSHKSKNSVLPYIVFPIIFSLIASVVLLPVVFRLNSTAKSYIGKAESVFAAGSYDVVVSDDKFTPSDVRSGTVTLDRYFEQGELIGSVICESAGLNTDLYYGNSNASLRNGAAVSADVLPGQDSVSYIQGYSTGAFKALKNIKVKDIINMKTSYGIYEYRVNDVRTVNSAMDSKSEWTDADLILFCSDSEKPFGNYGNWDYYVFAEKLSGPELNVKGEAAD